MSDEAQVTMQDIASQAGVDQSTVSLALRGSSKISEKTRKRIQEIAREMGYHPNPLISALMQNRKGRHANADILTLAYISFEELSDGIRGYIFAEFEEGARMEAERFGFKLEKFRVTRDLSLARINQIILARGIRGVVIAPLPDLRTRIQLSWDKLSAVAIGPTLRTPVLHRVMSDHYDNMRLLMDHSYESGYRRIGFCLQEITNKRTNGRWEACYLHYQQYHKTLANIPVFEPSDSPQPRFIEWVKKYRPDLVIGIRTARLMEWLSEAGYKTPRDISVATVAAAKDEEEISGIVEEGMGTGALAVSKLISLIYANETGIPKLPIKILVPARFNQGSTMH